MHATETMVHRPSTSIGIPRPLVAAISLIVVVACDPAVRIDGRVSNEAGEPVHHAEALVQCPELCVHGVSDAQGELNDEELGGCSMDCKLTVRAEGYETFVDEVKRFCVEPQRGWCRLVHVDVRLKRANSPAETAQSLAAPPSSSAAPRVGKP